MAKKAIETEPPERWFRIRPIILGLFTTATGAIIVWGAFFGFPSTESSPICQGSNRSTPICHWRARTIAYSGETASNHHNHPNDCWVIIDGVIYDFSQSRQPAYSPPDDLIMVTQEECGQDVSRLYKNRYQPPQEFIVGRQL